MVGALGAFAKFAYPPGPWTLKHGCTPGVSVATGRLALAPSPVTAPAYAGAGWRGVSRRRRRTHGPSSLGASPSSPAPPGSARDGRRRRRRRTSDNALEARPRPPHSLPWSDPSGPARERRDTGLPRPSARGPWHQAAPAGNAQPSMGSVGPEVRDSGKREEQRTAVGWWGSGWGPGERQAGILAYPWKAVADASAV